MGTNIDLGLFILRVGIGLNMLLLHGWAKLMAGTEKWAQLGGSMPSFGVSILPTVWGFLAAFAESIGSILLISGLFFRPATFMLAFTMAVAAKVHLGMPADQPFGGWQGAGSALTYLTIYAALLVSGPGKYALTLKR